MNEKNNYDLHIHTHLSSCASREAFIADYIKVAKDLGLTTIGFADHAWDESVAGASDWYKPQGYKRLAERRSEIPSDCGIDILLGAEGEYASFLLGFGEEGARYVDYIIVPHSHTHMKGFVLPDDCIGNPDKHAKYLLDSFIGLCGHEKRGLFFGIAHPMNPIGESYEYFEEIYSYISDSDLDGAVRAAKEANIALEVNLSSLNNIPPEARENSCYRRFYDSALRAGCDLFIGSDAHHYNTMRSLHNNRSELLKAFGLESYDFKSTESRILNG